MIALWLVVTKAYHAPMFAQGVPAHFDNAVIDLLPTGLQTGNATVIRHVSGKAKHLFAARDIPLPIVVTYTHGVPGFINSVRPLAPTPDVESKNGLGVEVRLGWRTRERWEAQDELEVDRILGRGLPFKAIDMDVRREWRFTRRTEKTDIFRSVPGM